jgi:phage gp36-like protein
MTYATKAIMIDAFGADELTQLTDRSEVTTGVIDDAVLGRALADADAEVDGYLAARYTLPLASVPRLVERLAADIARYRLYKDAVPEVVADRYRAAVRTLEALSKGTAALGLDQTGAQPTPAGTVQFTQGGRVFARDSDGARDL